MGKRARREVQYFFVVLLRTIFCFLPRKIGLRIGEILGMIGFIILREERNTTIKNLKNVFEKNEREILNMGRSVFCELGKNAVDAIRLLKMNSFDIERLVSVRGIEKFDLEMKKGKGIVVVTGHIGCWEMIPAFFAGRGYPVCVIARSLYDERLNKEIIKLRMRFGIKNIDRDKGGKEALKILRDGSALGILIDQDTRVAGVFVNFFGRKTYTPRGAAELAIRTGASIIPLFIHRNEDNTHTIEVEPTVEKVLTGDKERDILEITEKCSLMLEKFISQYPTQWVWMHERWKTKVNSD